jgi:hypothetical protein
MGQTSLFIALRYSLDVKNHAKHAERMSREESQTLIWALPPQVKKDFAGVRGRVKRAVAASPRSVTFAAAIEQVRLFSERSKKK